MINLYLFIHLYDTYLFFDFHRVVYWWSRNFLDAPSLYNLASWN